MEFARTVTTAVNFPWQGIYILETKTQKNFTHQLVCYLVHENCFTLLIMHDNERGIGSQTATKKGEIGSQQGLLNMNIVCSSVKVLEAK